jgi:dinuclear metal center YbgI/SA1388 family protein
MKLKELVEFLDDLLGIKDWDEKSKNGLQVEGKGDVAKVVFAVDACMDVFVKAKQLDADMVVVHHGLIWGGIEFVRGIVKNRLKFLLDNDISLYAVHLPLDAHPRIGNNAQLLRLLDIEPENPFGVYHGKSIGFWGEFEQAMSLDDVVKILRDRLNPDLRVLDFGSREIKRVGAVSGKGAFALAEAIEKGLDLFITGEAEHGAYHLAKEGKINVIFAGHYATETLGIKALMNVVGEEFAGELEVEFVDVPTGL